MTRRELTHPESGPVLLDARSIAARIEVQATDAPHATVTVSTVDDSGPSHDAVQAARLEHGAGRLTVRVQDRAATGGITVTGSGNCVSVSAVTVGRNVSIIGGRVIIDGTEVTPGMPAAPAASPVVIRASLPHGSTVQLATECGDIVARGHLEQADAQSVSGDVELEHADRASAQTTSGDIRIAHAHSARTTSVSGDSLIGHADSVLANAVSGDIEVRRADGHASAATVSGGIRIEHTGPAPLTRTVTGRVRVAPARPRLS